MATTTIPEAEWAELEIAVAEVLIKQAKAFQAVLKEDNATETG